MPLSFVCLWTGRTVFKIIPIPFYLFLELTKLRQTLTGENLRGKCADDLMPKDPVEVDLTDPSVVDRYFPKVG